ncbi:cytochrome P450 [Multifurca ochricompacta]|uniref:Cytochrome P450 n=1 Tax=Multifurca ochricompacta TaxID=376703 RepID=A0AAD4M110_9AGAM|nr:cytochrome P450 [Multifurca ochricompacta]
MNAQSDALPALLAVVVVFLIYVYAHFRRRGSFLSQLQGPKSHSFWIGNEGEIFHQNEVGDCEFKWMRQFGSAWRHRGCLGVDHLMVADPKALQYILHTSGYNFPKKIDLVKVTEMVTGKALSCAHGKVHERQRKILAPSFFASQLKVFLPIFQDVASKLVQKWKDELATSDPSGSPPFINVTGWVSRATFDIMGQAGFDFHFGSLDGAETQLSKMYGNLFLDSTLYPSPFNLVFKSTWRYVPEFLLRFVRYLPTRECRRFREYLDYAREFSRDVAQKNMAKGDGNDMMSVFLRTNASEDPKYRLKGPEIVDQLSALLLAGQETTASSLTWFFWEIARHPESQERIREEISVVYRRNNGAELSAADLDGMTYTQAALKESMRLHPIVWMLGRVASRDDAIPLAFPITTKSGQQVSSIPVKKGTIIDIAVHAYQRLPEVWGEDAGEWNPDRFLNFENVKQTSLGVYGNLLNFSGGPQGCIGWRFAVLEMLVIISTLIKDFEFSIPLENEKKIERIYRKPSVIMMPMAEGRIGAWMGLVIKPLN